MKKITSILLTALLTLSIGKTAFALELAPTLQSRPNPYQEVLDKLNKEYGTDVHFATNEEIRDLGIKAPYVTVSVKEFELQMKEDIEANIEANEDAYTSSQKLASVKTEDAGSGECKVPDTSFGVKASSTITRSKDIAGATTHLTATVNNSAGYWKYSSIGSVWTTYQAGYNSTPAFSARTYNYSLIDTRRTCALSLYGYTVGNWGVILDNNAYRYVEFWAGSGM